MKRAVLPFLSLLLSVIAMAQSEGLLPLHVSGNRLCDSQGNHITLHGVMDTPSPYFNRHRWGYVCNDTTARAAIAYYDKIFAALNNSRKGTFCDLRGPMTLQNSLTAARRARPTSHVSVPNA